MTRSILAAWATLLALAFGVERPLLGSFGTNWIATAHLALDCLSLAAAGWVSGRLYRSRGLLAAALFAATLCFWDFGDALTLNVPWLLRLVWNSLHDSRFIDSLIANVETHVLLFGCLFAGAALSRERAKPLSIVG